MMKDVVRAVCVSALRREGGGMTEEATGPLAADEERLKLLLCQEMERLAVALAQQEKAQIRVRECQLTAIYYAKKLAEFRRWKKEQVP